MEQQEVQDFFIRLDRAAFVDEPYKEWAYANRPLPIGHEQTISQPSLVVKMTLALDPDKTCAVLEIGTGSGYQTAILAEYAKAVYTVEKIEALSNRARDRLLKFGYTNVCYRVGDGSEGWTEYAPYDRIIVTAAAGSMPEELVRQLKIGGRMIVPVGPKGMQDLVLVTKDAHGAVHREILDQVTFVEMKGKYGWGKN